MDPKALKALRGIEVPHATQKSPLKSVLEQPRFPGELVQGPTGARGLAAMAAALSRPRELLPAFQISL